MSILDTVQQFGSGGGARRTLIYGDSAVGKTTWASRWPDPLLVPTEDGFRHVNVRAFPDVITTAYGVWDACREIIEKKACKTLLLDSIDWFEVLCQADVEAEGIDQGWGRGSRELGKRVRGLLTCLGDARAQGIDVVLIGHQMVDEIKRPDGLSYQTYNVKLSPKARELVVEWCDEVVYASRDYGVRNAKDGNPGVGVDKGVRRLYTEQTPFFKAKNRVSGLPDKFDLNDFETYYNLVKGVNHGS